MFKALAVAFPYNVKKMSNRETTHPDSQFQQSTNPSVGDTKINSFPSRPESTNPQRRVSGGEQKSNRFLIKAWPVWPCKSLRKISQSNPVWDVGEKQAEENACSSSTLSSHTTLIPKHTDIVPEIKTHSH